MTIKYHCARYYGKLYFLRDVEKWTASLLPDNQLWMSPVVHANGNAVGIEKLSVLRRSVLNTLVEVVAYEDHDR